MTVNCNVVCHIESCNKKIKQIKLKKVNIHEFALPRPVLIKEAMLGLSAMVLKPDVKNLDKGEDKMVVE